MIRRRLTRPVLIGRDEQQRFLLEAVESVRAGAGQVVVISGEAGIGKSRLVAEARLEADRHSDRQELTRSVFWLLRSK